MDGPDAGQEVIAAIARDALLDDDVDGCRARAGSAIAEHLGVPLAAVLTMLDADPPLTIAAIQSSGKRLVRSTASILEAARDRQRHDARARLLGRMQASRTLAETVVHDFNGVLGAIANFAELAAADVAPGTLAAADLEQVREGARRGIDLTRRLLVLAPEPRWYPEALTLALFIEEFEPELVSVLGENVRVETHVSPEVRRVRIDGSDLKEILFHLAQNARDAMPDGGRLDITAIDGSIDDGPIVRLSVRDTGAGMAPDVAARAADPFFTTKPIGSGEGLGLSAALGLVSAVGGAFEIDSLPGRGTTIHLQLPVELDRVRRKVG
jgi:signal transduction histidine kinase